MIKIRIRGAIVPRRNVFDLPGVERSLRKLEEKRKRRENKKCKK